jgi:ankyrin repeat protein
MARKKAQKKKEQITTLVPHRTPNLRGLLQSAKHGASAAAVSDYLAAGGTPVVSFQGFEQQISLLHYMAVHNPRPHSELAESVRLLVAAGADINTMVAFGPDGSTALMCASTRTCCTAPLQAFLDNGADALVRSANCGTTALHQAAAVGRTDSCGVLLAKENSLVHMKDDFGFTAMIFAVRSGTVATVKVLLQHVQTLTQSTMKA